MPYKQVLFHFAAREKLLRGASQLADAIRVTLGPKSKSVLIQKQWGAPIVCNDGLTIAKEFDLENAEENLGVQVLRQAAEKTGDVVGDGTSTATILAHAIFSDGSRNVVAGASAIDLKRGSRPRVQARCRIACEGCAAQSPRARRRRRSATISAHNNTDDRGARRRCDGEGRPRRGHYRRGIEDDGDGARSRRRHAVRSRLRLALFRHRTGKDGGGSEEPLILLLCDRKISSLQGSAAAARRGREVGPAAAGRRRGRRGRGARDPHRQPCARRA